MFFLSLGVHSPPLMFSILFVLCLFVWFQDLVLIAQTLEENMYDVDSSISYVLQMMCVAEDQGK